VADMHIPGVSAVSSNQAPTVLFQVRILTKALALLDDPHSMYQAENETVCSILNQAFFLRLYIDGTKVTGHELGEPFDILHDSARP
jgi:hypothetical protein